MVRGPDLRSCGGELTSGRCPLPPPVHFRSFKCHAKEHLMAPHCLPDIRRLANSDPDLFQGSCSPSSLPSLHSGLQAAGAGGVFSCPQALWVLFPWFASLPSALTFCMKFPPSRLSSSGALLGPHRQTCRLLPSLLPSVVLTSLLEHVPRPALDDWVHLSFPSTTFTCLEAESVADSFPYPPAPDILSIRVSSPPIFEDMQR